MTYLIIATIILALTEIIVLPFASKRLLQMVYIEQLPINEICERFDGISEPTYYVWLRKAEKLLED